MWNTKPMTQKSSGTSSTCIWVNSADLVDQLTIALKERRIELDGRFVDRLRDESKRLSLLVDRLAYAVEAAAAVADLDAQIVQDQADERLRAERLRVAAKRKS